MVFVATVAALLIIRSCGHAIMLEPLARSAQQMVGHAHSGIAMAGDCTNVSCAWYQQQAYLPKNGTVTNCDIRMRTLGVTCGATNPTDFPCIGPMKAPWCAPGTTPVLSPCGVFNGGYNQQGRDQLDLPGNVQATWASGGTATVAFALTANHGGGYSYRMCSTDRDLTESCFQMNTLDFVNQSSWIIDRDGRVISEFTAARTSKGTFPKDSTWTRCPIPMEGGSKMAEALFGKPPAPDFYGAGPTTAGRYVVKDLVKVPDFPEGKYVLSFRLDAESTRQVWQSCSDVRIIGKKRQAPAQVSSRPVCVGQSWGLDVTECEAWVDFYDKMNGPNWRGCSTARLDPCGCPQSSWGHTLFCNTFQNYQHITEIYLLHNNLRGKIPSSIGRFKRLLALDLSENDIYGAVPSELGHVPTLQALWLHHNPRLGGHLPMSLAMPNFYASNYNGATSQDHFQP